MKGRYHTGDEGIDGRCNFKMNLNLCGVGMLNGLIKVSCSRKF
jgi:hypothetical protein